MGFLSCYYRVMKIILISLLVLVVCIICVYLYNTSFFSVRQKDSNQRIVFVSGSYTEPKYLNAWQSYLDNLFPNQEVIVFRKYYPYGADEESIRQLIQTKNELVAVLQENNTKPTRVITYSYGAVILSAALRQIEDQGGSVNITKTVTIAGPIGPNSAFADKGFLESRVQIGYDFENKLPNHNSVCGYFDSLVSCKRATYQNEQSIKTFSNHYTYVLPQLFSGRTILTELMK